MFCFNVNVSVSVAVVASVCLSIDIRMFSQWIFRDRYRLGVQLEFPIQFAKLVNLCDICPLC
mgnify:CR=1 FL=1